MVSILERLKKIRDIYLSRIKWGKYSIGKNFHAGRGVAIWAKKNLSIGDNFYIGRYSLIECDAEIGDNVIIGNFVGIVGKFDHNFQQVGTPIRSAMSIRDKDYRWKGYDLKVVIESDVWIGHGAVILSGTHVKRGCIIAAGSVLTRDTEPFSIYAGNPAKKIRARFDTQEQLDEHMKLTT